MKKYFIILSISLLMLLVALLPQWNRVYNALLGNHVRYDLSCDKFMTLSQSNEIYTKHKEALQKIGVFAVEVDITRCTGKAVLQLFVCCHYVKDDILTKYGQELEGMPYEIYNM